MVARKPPELTTVRVILYPDWISKKAIRLKPSTTRLRNLEILSGRCPYQHAEGPCGGDDLASHLSQAYPR